MVKPEMVLSYLFFLKKNGKHTETGKYMNETLSKNRMGYEPVGKLLISMSWPAILSMMVNALYNIIDSMFVGMICEDALSAVTYAYPVVMLNVAFAVGTGVGINSLMSRRLGAGRIEEAQKVANHGIRLAIMNWILFAIFGIFLAKPYLHAYTDTQYILTGGLHYMQITNICSIFVMTSIMIERLFQATGKMKVPMIASLTGAVANTVLDPLFIFGIGPFPEMGIEGAAVATVLGQAFSFIINLTSLKRHNDIFNIRLRGFRFEKQILADIYQVAFSAIVMQSITSEMLLFMNGILVKFSETAVAVIGSYFRLQTFVFMPIFGMNQGAMPIIGYNYGARNRDRLMKTFNYSFLIAFCYMTLGFLIFQLFPAQLLGLFSAGEHMLSIGIPALKTISWSFIMASFCIMSITLFQATGHGLLSVMSPIIRQLLGIIPIAYILINSFGLNSVWLAFPIAEIMGTIWSICGFAWIMKHEIKTM